MQDVTSHVHDPLPIESQLLQLKIEKFATTKNFESLFKNYWWFYIS